MFVNMNTTNIGTLSFFLYICLTSNELFNKKKNKTKKKIS